MKINTEMKIILSQNFLIKVVFMVYDFLFCSIQKNKSPTLLIFLFFYLCIEEKFKKKIQKRDRRLSILLDEINPNPSFN